MCDPTPSVTPPTRPDMMFGGRLLLHQMPRGHRAGTDAVLLAAAAGVRPGDRFIDVGAGTGAVGLSLAMREAASQGVLLESDGELAALALRNVEVNAMQSRVSVRCADLFGPAVLVGEASLVVTNPPFYDSGTVRPSSDAARAAAHVVRAGLADPHAEWLKRCCSMLKARGRLVAIHRPEALPSLLKAAEPRLGGLVLRPIHARADRQAIRILLCGILGGRAPVQILPPLVLHKADGAFTDEAEALHRGADMAFWPKKTGR